MLQPLRRRTWAPRGQTPYHHPWQRHDRLSCLAALSVSPQRRRLHLYFQLVRENVNKKTMIWFLTNLHAQFGRPIVLIWDRWSVHRSAAKHFRMRLPHWFEFEWLPGYAPDLNPVEQCWNHTKYTDLANFIPFHVDHLELEATRSLNHQRKTKERLKSFFKYPKLTL